MRIISGLYKGRKLISSSDFSIRPTTDRVKEFIFNVLQNFPEGKKVVDIFSGSGSLGLEALSRGAVHVVFVEKAETALKILEQNIKNLSVPPDKYQIIKADAIRFAETEKMTIDLCLLDPPFVYPQLQNLIELLFTNAFFTRESIAVVEHEISNPLALDAPEYNILKQKKFGRSLITFMEIKDNDESKQDSGVSGHV